MNGYLDVIVTYHILILISATISQTSIKEHACFYFYFLCSYVFYIFYYFFHLFIATYTTSYQTITFSDKMCYFL